MPSPQSKKRVQRLLKDRREWMVNSADFVKGMGVRGVKEDLRGDPWTAVKVLPVGLQQLCVFFAIRRITGLFDGKSEAWSDVDRAIAYHGWCVKLKSEAFFNQRRIVGHEEDVHPIFDTSVGACLLAYGMCFDNTGSWLSFARDFLLKLAVTPDSIDLEYWVSRKLEPFVLRLLQKMEDVDLPNELARRPLGVYDDVFATGIRRMRWGRRW